MKAHSPLVAGMTGRCPVCGKGKLYNGYLKLVDSCSSCSASLSNADAEDAPVTFLLVLVGGIGMLGIIVTIVKYDLPPWLVLAIWIPIIIALSIVILPLAKGMLTALQHRYQAGEGSIRERAAEDGSLAEPDPLHDRGASASEL